MAKKLLSSLGLQVVIDLIVTIIRVLYSFIEVFVNYIFAKESSVQDKIVLITGAGQGIGRELAFQYGALGAIVVCVDINEKSNQETVERLTLSKVTAYGYRCDITDRKAVLELALKVEKEVGRVKILVNNAGVLQSKSLLHHTEKDVKSIFNVNIIAQFWTLQAFLPSMIKAKDGHIVSICSAAAHQSQANIIAYSSSKFAVKGLMEGLEKENDVEKWNLHFTTAYPFFVDTGMCKYPQMRFSWQRLLDAKYVAREVVKAQRRREDELTLPRYMGALAFCSNLVPRKTVTAVAQFLRLGVKEDVDSLQSQENPGLLAKQSSEQAKKPHFACKTEL